MPVNPNGMPPGGTPMGGMPPGGFSPEVMRFMTMISQGVVADFLSRFPKLGIIAPNEPVVVNRQTAMGPVATPNTWAQLLAEQCDRMYALTEATNRLAKAIEDAEDLEEERDQRRRRRRTRED